MREIKFSGCESLDFSDNYRPACKLQQLDNGHLFWWRNWHDVDLRMVQFCKKRGRLNNPTMCINKANAMCSEYKEIQHRVKVEQAELDS